jgi:uncharacterized membrane protein YfcA
MHTQFLGVPDITPLIFSALAAAAFCTAVAGVTLGAAGGLVLFAIMAAILPITVLVPVHTVVQLGSSCSRTALMWRYVMRWAMLPFLVGAVLGAAIGARVFVALPITVLQGAMAVFVLVIAWLPKIGRVGAARSRFAVLGFGVTFLGIFVSATGTLLAPFVASAAPDRRNHSATLGALMMMTHISKLVAFGVIGIAIGAYIPLVAAMIVGTVLGNYVGRQTLNYMPERLFRIAFKLLMTVLGLRMLWVAARGAGWI